MPTNNKNLGRPSKNEKDPTNGMDDKFIFQSVTVVLNERGQEIDQKTSASKTPVENPKSTDLGTSVISIKAENNNKDIDR